MSEELTYYLPETRIRFTGTERRTVDTILDDETVVELVDPSFAFEVWRDREARFTISLEAGTLRDLDVDIGISEDRRLTSFGATSTGQVGEAIKAAMSLAGTVAAFALPALTPVPQTKGLRAAKPARRKPSTPAERAWAAYEAAQPDAAAQTESYRALRKAVVGDLLTARRRLIEVVREPASRVEAERVVVALERTLADVDGELARLRAIFEAWRSTTRKVHERELSGLYELRRFPRLVNGALDWSSASTDGVDRTVRELWDQYGVALARDEAHSDKEKTLEIVHGDTKRKGIWVRHPRLVALPVCKKGDDGEVVIERTERRLVMDDKSPREFIPFETPLWGKRSLSLEFSGLGAVTRIKEGRSGSADIVKALGEAPGGLAAGLETGSKTLTSIGALAARSQTDDIARIKREIEKKQQELLQKGLEATEGDHVELERLKQWAAIAQNRQTLSGLPTGLYTDLVDGTLPTWYQKPKPASPPPPPEPPVNIVITLPEGSNANR